MSAGWSAGWLSLLPVMGAGFVLIFAGLTAYDTQKLKDMYVTGNFDTEAAAKVSVFGALTLYLDFINMFQFLLALFGNRNE